MATITVCDRCNKLIGRTDPIFIISSKTNTRHTNAIGDPIGNKIFSTEVCAACAGKIKVFVESKK